MKINPLTSELREALSLYKISPSASSKGLIVVWLPRQDDFRNFCMSEETEKVYRKLEYLIKIS